MASGLFTIQSVGGSGPSYALTVDSSAGVVTSDHVVGPLLSGTTHGGIYRVTGVPDGTTINIQDDLVPGGGAYGAPTSGAGAFWTPTANTLSTSKANDTPFWGDVTERDFLILDGAASAGAMGAEDLTYTDTTNKILGPLSGSPISVSAVSLFVLTGVLQEYTVDYTVREVVGGSSPGFYVCVATGSTAPGGGSFSGGTNPGTGIDSLIASGEKTRVLYPRSV